MHERQIHKIVAAHGVTHADDGAHELVGEPVHKQEQVARVVRPVRIVAHVRGVERGAVALPRDVGDPDGAQAEVLGREPRVQLVPERLVELFGEAVGVGREDRNVPC